jgi:acetyl-CoA C-acetyltransferase
MVNPSFNSANSLPVIIGVGQVTHHDRDELVTPVDLIERAVTAAEDDAGARVRAETSGLFLSPPWAQDGAGAGAAVAERLGLPARLCWTGPFSGSTPQELLGQACQAIASGELAMAVVTGGVADASVKAALDRGVNPVAAASFGAALGTRPTAESDAPRQPPTTPEQLAGVDSALAIFAMVESGLWATAGGTGDDRRAWLGRMLAPFTSVAERHPGAAWFPVSRLPADIATVTPGNRLVADPYTKLMTSFPMVDMAAALIVTSAATAARLGVPRSKWVYPWAIASRHEEQPPSLRPRIDHSEALSAAVEQVLRASSRGPGDIDRFDLYSCFPSAVQLAADALDLDVFDPRGLTVTGGLPYFGGPGAAYVVMSIAAMAAECRADSGSVGAVVGVGGFVSHFSAGLYSAAEPPGAFGYDDGAGQPAGDAAPAGLGASGDATVLAGTVMYDRAGPVVGPVIAELPDGRRTGARLRTREAAAAVAGQNLAGRRIQITTERDGLSYYEPL